MIKAIETVYRGYRFRSRLEARWAVFFDTLGVKWEYEKEGFDLGEAGWYLPDFWLPQQQVWVEIKGNKPTDDEKRKCFLLADGLTYPVIMFWGAMGYDDLDGRPEFKGEVFLGFHPPNPKYFPYERSTWDYYFGFGYSNHRNFLQHSATMGTWWRRDGGLPVKVKVPPNTSPFLYHLQEKGYTVDYSLNGRDWIIHLIEMETRFFKEDDPTCCGREFGMSFDASPILKNGVLIFDYDEDRGESVRFAINAACSARFEHKKRNTRY